MRRPQMTDGVVHLEAPTLADVDAIARACQDALIAQWVPIPQPYTAEDARTFVERVVQPGWESGTELTWAVRDGSGGLLGMVGLHQVGHGTAEIGYWLAPWARGRGVMTRAVALVVEHALDPAGLDLLRVSWRAMVGNWPSRRVAWRAGFRVEGTVRGELVHREGVRRDAWVGTILRGDPRRPNEPWPGTAAGETDHEGRARSLDPAPRDVPERTRA